MLQKLLALGSRGRGTSEVGWDGMGWGVDGNEGRPCQ